MTTEQVILSAILTLTASILTAFLTSKITRDNEMRKIIHQKRLELYLEVFEQVELLLKDWKKIFDKEYFEKIEGTKIIQPKVNVKVDNLLREFILGGGFEIEMPE